MSQQTIADDLKAARALLEKGWCKNALEWGGSFCALGAIAQATAGSAYDWNERSMETFEAVRPLLPSKYRFLDDYNNAAETTHGDVLNLFDKALAELGALA